MFTLFVLVVCTTFNRSCYNGITLIELMYKAIFFFALVFSLAFVTVEFSTNDDDGVQCLKIFKYKRKSRSINLLKGLNGISFE